MIPQAQYPTGTRTALPLALGVWHAWDLEMRLANARTSISWTPQNHNSVSKLETTTSPLNDSSNLEEQTNELLRDIANTTLGFERVFAIGFSDRMDKRDAMTTGASLLDMDLEWIEGVRASEMNDKAYPASISSIVANKIRTALIFEDDIDWDVTLKAQLKEFARGACAIQDTETSHSPYGDNWDTLWLGSCAMRSRDASRLYMIPNEPTVRPVSHRGDFWWPDFSDRRDMQHSRFVLDGADGLCTLAYAVTYDAARKILATLSLEPNNSPFDMNLNGLCDSERKGVHFRCLAPYPPLFNSWRKAGSSFRDSDIVDLGDEWHEAFSSGITYSTMLNAKRLVDGAKTATAQWPDVEVQEMDFEKFESPKGSLISLNGDTELGGGGR
ncbi:uncharacterized protein N7482_003606 [Penicillium canariense]|uniref:Glycosyltransferase family 25 protein n=1 Tax=Penicillium canariense TaxID=189055 RepID=A0A9W9LNT4_9EURO|nr:uncharacterized protein N7482_003606 [Penicillium canariense]KAJ5168012.1 hypothetical protein N7482_003606 [Penicillium canariense]